MPHERGRLPVLPSEFCCPLSPIPKLACLLARQPLAALNGNSAYPVDSQALTTLLLEFPESSTITPDSPVRRRALSPFPERATPFACFLSSDGRDRKTRNDYRSASSPVLQLKNQTT